MNNQLPRLFPHIYRVIAQVPKGKVVTYGQVAALVGVPQAPRAVGMALRYLPPALSRTVPWQRVINASGGISIRGDVFRVEEQRWLLENEGIEFDRHGKVNLKKYRWEGLTKAGEKAKRGNRQTGEKAGRKDEKGNSGGEKRETGERAKR